jgi:tetratricopeptide (TPR) repeat protein
MKFCLKNSFVNLLFLVAAVFPAIIHSQNSKIDSLEKIAELNKKDTSTVLALNTLSDNLVRTGDPLKAYEYSKRGLALSQELDYLRGKIISNLALARTCQFLSKFDEGLKYSTEAIFLSRNTGFKRSYASALTIAGVIHIKQSTYGKAMDFLLMGLKANEEIKDTVGMVNALSQIGILYSKLSEYDNALREYKKCLIMAQRSGYEHGLANTYINISNVFAAEKQLDSSNVYLFKALEVFERIKMINNVAVVYGNLSLNYMDMGKFDLSLKYLNECMAIARQTGNIEGVVNTYLTFTDLYYTMKDYKMGKIYADSGLALAKELNLLSMERDMQLMLYRNNKEVGNYKASLEAYEEYVKINNEIVNEEGKKAIQHKEMEFEFQKKEAAINSEREKEALLAKEEKRKQQIVIYSVSAILILVLVVLVIIFRSLKLNKAKNKIISEQKAIVEEKQREILDSIRYAKRIQTSLLPTEKYFDKNIKRPQS